MKRVVEKLQVENKRLVGGSRPCTAVSDLSVSTYITVNAFYEHTYLLSHFFLKIANEKLKIEHQRLKDQYVESMRKVTKVRQELVSANNKIKSLENQVSCPELPNLRSELARVKKESDHKTELLDKIKNLLQRAAVKEKALIEEVRLILIF